jgi:hypothetical protein
LETHKGDTVKEKRHVMKPLLAGLGVLLVLLLWSGTVQAVSINWGAAGNPLYDEGGVGGQKLERGDVVQLICDRARDGMDPPGSSGMPTDDDELIHDSYIGHGSFFDGEFADDITTGSVGIGDVLYVRAWNDSTLESAGRWGDTRQHGPETWVVDNSMFFTLNATENGSWATTSYKLRLHKAVHRLMLGGADRRREETVSWEAKAANLLFSEPNPFREKTTLKFRMGDSRPKAPLRLEIFDVRGCLVRRFALDAQIEKDRQIVWDGRDEGGRSVRNGVYLCVLYEIGCGPALIAKLIRAE